MEAVDEKTTSSIHEGRVIHKKIRSRDINTTFIMETRGAMQQMRMVLRKKIFKRISQGGEDLLGEGKGVESVPNARQNMKETANAVDTVVMLRDEGVKLIILPSATVHARKCSCL